MKPQRVTQFDLDATLQSRPLERAILRHRWFNVFLHCVGTTGLSLLVWPRFVAPFRWLLTRYDMPLRGLDDAFRGYRILQLSDFHLGRARLGYITRVVERCRAEQPDLIVLTGDLIHYSRKGLEVLPGVLRRLHAPDGVLAIFGNHDYHEYSWRHVGARSARRGIQKRLVRIVEESGVTLLRNQSVTLRRGDATLKIVGLGEMWADQFNPAQAFAGIAPDDVVICLQHNPDGAAKLLDYNWQWLLAGHSHGGQVDVPLLGPMYIPQEHREWVRGCFDLRGTDGTARKMFVSCGVGYSNPVRFRVPPEATLFTLKPSGTRGVSDGPPMHAPAPVPSASW